LNFDIKNGKILKAQFLLRIQFTLTFDFCPNSKHSAARYQQFVELMSCMLNCLMWFVELMNCMLYYLILICVWSWFGERFEYMSWM